MEALKTERNRRRATIAILGKKGLCRKMSVEFYELQPRQSGGESFVVARLWRGPLTSWIKWSYNDVNYNFSGHLLATYPPINSEAALKASVVVGHRLTSDGEKRRWKNLTNRVQLGGMVESEFCCSICESDWAFEDLILAVELRTASSISSIPHPRIAIRNLRSRIQCL